MRALCKSRAFGLAVLAAALSGCLGDAPRERIGSDASSQVDPSWDATAEAEADDAGTATDAASIDATSTDQAHEAEGGADAAAGPPACLAGGACSPGACQLGSTSCDDAGAMVCTGGALATNGSPCDAGADAYAVCSGGSCNTCNAGADCTPAGSCQQMNIVCTSGSPVCTAEGNVTDGKSCGTNLFCNGGQCKSCTAGANCAPIANACDQGTVTCSAGQVVCNDKHVAVADGASCGINRVCSSGQCLPCTANVACTVVGYPCHAGLTSCATGVSVCVDKGPVQDGTVCTGTNLCNRTYACQAGVCTGANPVVCPAPALCHGPSTCNPTTGTCSSAPLTGTSCNDANGCTTGDTCQNGNCTGTPVTCAASDRCHQAGTCSSTGDSSYSCSNPVLADGTSCGVNMACSGGSCGCAPNRPSCGGSCVDTATDPANCGACGHSCLGGGCSQGLCQPFTVGASPGGTGWSLTLDANNAYFATFQGHLYSVPKNGSAGPALITSALSAPASLLYDAPTNQIFVSDTYNGAIEAWPTSGSPTSASATQATNNPYTLVSDANYVYWGRAQGVFRAPKALTSATQVISLGSVTIGALALDPGSATLYGGTISDASGVIVSAPTSSTGAYTYVAATDSHPQAAIAQIVIAGGDVYWINKGSTAANYTDGGLYVCAGGTCAQPTAVSGANPLTQGTCLLADSSFLYYLANGSLYRCPLAGCGTGPTLLASNLSPVEAAGCAMDANSFYFLPASGALQRLAR